jgi:hypothetical protein
MNAFALVSKRMTTVTADYSWSARGKGNIWCRRHADLALTQSA